jgi:hypothetical protein
MLYLDCSCLNLALGIFLEFLEYFSWLLWIIWLLLDYSFPENKFWKIPFPLYFYFFLLAQPTFQPASEVWKGSLDYYASHPFNPLEPVFSIPQPSYQLAHILAHSSRPTRSAPARQPGPPKPIRARRHGHGVPGQETRTAPPPARAPP